MDALIKGKFLKDTKKPPFKIISKAFRVLFGNGDLFLVKVHITNRCNQSCPHCYIPKDNIDLNKKYINRIADNINSGVIDLAGGEPLLRDDIYEIIRYIKSKKLKCGLYTNGSLITKKVAKDLKRAGLDTSVITLNSDIEQEHNNLIGCNNWNSIVEGIRNLVSEGIIVYVYTPVHRVSIGKLKDIRNFSKSLGARQIFHKYMPRSYDDDLVINDKEEWYRAKNEILYEINPVHRKHVERLIKVFDRTCVGGLFEVSIKSNGDVTPCPFINDLVLGNIKHKNLRDIFNKRFENKQFLDFFNPPKECTDCSVIGNCKGGCRAVNSFKNDGYSARDMHCKGPFHESPSTDDLCRYLPYWM